MKWAENRLLGWVAVAALMFGMQFAVNHDLATGAPPPLSGQTLDGQRFDLAQLRGRPALIYFWASWCPICRGMQGTVQAVAADVPFISVAMQSGNAQEVAQYQRNQGWQVPTLLDEDGALAARFGLRGVPALFVLGADGTIRHATTGYTSELGLRARLWLAGW
ncbi:MAG: protein disulfide oxidoreductase [Candidatus Methylumidiphilus sp.]